uniref:Uncharacterized protein n=1 Tax=Anguilla anguilla TaxID=7936 RepID=A0A0E9P721_ANGAN
MSLNKPFQPMIQHPSCVICCYVKPHWPP